MFERNRVDSAPLPSFVPVELALADGSLLTGRLAVPVGRTTVDVINGQGSFIDFEPYDGERRFVAKGQINEIQLTGVPGAPELKPRVRGHDEFDPHGILGVAPTAGWDEVRQAYVQLAKTYHPDRYSSALLPGEVKDYLETMARRINAAYAALDSTHKVVKKAAFERSAPVFTSPPR